MVSTAGVGKERGCEDPSPGRRDSTPCEIRQNLWGRTILEHAAAACVRARKLVQAKETGFQGLQMQEYYRHCQMPVVQVAGRLVNISESLFSAAGVLLFAISRELSRWYLCFTELQEQIFFLVDNESFVNWGQPCSETGKRDDMTSSCCCNFKVFNLI